MTSRVIRKYAVTYWCFLSGMSPEDITVEVEAYDAQDAAFQALIGPRAQAGSNQGLQISLRRVEPMKRRYRKSNVSGSEKK